MWFLERTGDGSPSTINPTGAKGTGSVTHYLEVVIYLTLTL